jgi:hypothetical protein
MEKKKTKFDVKIEVFDNGQSVIIKRVKDRKLVGNKLFLNGQEATMKTWITKTMEDNK